MAKTVYMLEKHMQTWVVSVGLLVYSVRNVSWVKLVIFEAICCAIRSVVDYPSEA